MTPEERLEARRAAKRKWKADPRNTEKVRESTRRAHARHKADRNRRSLNNRYLKVYGISLQEKADMYARQNGRCRICQEPMKPNGRSKDAAAVDHCHQTGRVRGLLCGLCNRALGLFRENTNSLRAAIEYLETQCAA